MYSRANWARSRFRTCSQRVLYNGVGMPRAGGPKALGLQGGAGGVRRGVPLARRMGRAPPCSSRCGVWCGSCGPQFLCSAGCCGLLLLFPHCCPRICIYYTPGRDGTRNAARRPGSGGCTRGCGFEEQGGHVLVYRGGLSRIQRGVYPL